MVSDVTQELSALSSWSALIFLGLARKSFMVLPTPTPSARDLTHVKHVVYSTLSKLCDSGSPGEIRALLFGRGYLGRMPCSLLC